MEVSRVKGGGGGSFSWGASRDNNRTRKFRKTKEGKRKKKENWEEAKAKRVPFGEHWWGGEG